MCLLFKTNLNIVRYTFFGCSIYHNATFLFLFKAVIPSSLLIFMYYTKWDIPGGVNINSTKLIFSNCLLVQIDDFRRLHMYSKDERPTNGCEGRLLDNFRPVKPLHGRVVKASFQWSLKLCSIYLLLVLNNDIFMAVFRYNYVLIMYFCVHAMVLFYPTGCEHSDLHIVTWLMWFRLIVYIEIHSDAIAIVFWLYMKCVPF